MNRHLIAFLALGAVCSAAAAQNLNPEIVVTNEYETRMPEVPKADLPMAMPDSLREFKLDFDYSVFDNPYEGTREFNPYIVRLRPEKSEQYFTRFWLKAGAGWSMHPELAAAWTGRTKRGSTISLLQDFGGYWGRYREVGANLRTVAGSRWDGYDFAERLGASARFSLGKADAYASLRYKGIFTGEPSGTASWNGVGADFRLASPSTALKYDAGLHIDAGADRSPAGLLNETLFGMDGRLEPTIASLPFRVAADAALDLAFYGGVLDTRAMRFLFGPKAIFRFGKLNLSAGLNLDVAATAGNPAGQFTRAGQLFYPDVRADIDFLDGAMTAYALVTGGATPWTYSSLKTRNHRFSPLQAPVAALMDYELERLNATAGLRGVIAKWFSYDASAGYGFYSGSPFFGVCSNTWDGSLSPVVGYDDMELFHADLAGHIRTAHLSCDGALLFRHARVTGTVPAVLPAPFAANVSARYSHDGRLGFSALVEASGRRRAVVADCSGVSYIAFNEGTIPGYADISLGADWQVTRIWTLWGRVGNLLDADIQRTPLYVENGINFTAGICLKL